MTPARSGAKTPALKEGQQAWCPGCGAASQRDHPAACSIGPCPVQEASGVRGTAATLLWPIWGPIKPGQSKFSKLSLVLAAAHTGSPHALGTPGPRMGASQEGVRG